MAESETPPWYAIGHVVFIAVSVLLLSLINGVIEHKRPQKAYKQHSYKYNGSQPEASEKETITSELPAPEVITEKKEVEPENEKIVDPPISKIDLSSLGDEDYFSEMVKNYEANVLTKLERPDSRNDVVVRYYTKEKDKEKIYGLRKYGFYIHERPSDPVYAEATSNALYYGDDVKNEDIQLVAYVLIKSGVALKEITPSKLHDDWKANSLEIGADTLANKLPTLSLMDIRKQFVK